MAASEQVFYCVLQKERICDQLFSLVSTQDMCALRLASSACCNLVTRRLFRRTHLTFTADSFMRPARIQALSRVGHHVEHLVFRFPHTNATFLPPLIHPRTGQELRFHYTPHTSLASAQERPQILTLQYPPLFHAASHVSSFITALTHMPNMRHLTIATPGQPSSERYRRSIVDYALISLRIAVERAPLTRLAKLTLSAVHPSAFVYLRHQPGFGASPASPRRWRQIRKLYVSVESWDFYGPAAGLDHLNILEDFFRAFAPHLHKLSFSWLGQKGPCPLALAGDPLFAPPRSTRKLFHEMTSPMSPLPALPPRQPPRMPRLRYLSVSNATMNAPQVRALVDAHKGTVREFDFDKVVLLQGGSWDEALSPLDSGADGTDAWSRRSMPCSETSSPPSPPTAVASPVVVNSTDDQQLPSPSAAVAAARKELFDVDLEEGTIFHGGPADTDVDALEADVQAWAHDVKTAAAQHAGGASEALGIMLPVSDGDDALGPEMWFATAPPRTPRPPRQSGLSDDSMTSDIEAARQASMAFSTSLKKHRVRKRSHRADGMSETAHVPVSTPGRDECQGKDARRHRSSNHNDSHHSSHHGGRHGSQHGSHHDSHRDSGENSQKSRHEHSRSDDINNRSTHRSHSRSSSGSGQRRHRRHRRHRSDEPPPPPPLDDMPEVVGTDDEMDLVADVSAPTLDPDACPVLLQPAVYDPSSPSRSAGTCRSVGSDGLGAGVSWAQGRRTSETEDEAAARSSALRRAKAAVLTKLSREFGTKPICDTFRNVSSSGSGNGNGSGSPTVLTARANGRESAAVASLKLDLGSGYTPNSLGTRIKEGLFGRGGGGGGGGCAVSSQHSAVYYGGGDLDIPGLASYRMSLGSRSALVPLIISRS